MLKVVLHHWKQKNLCFKISEIAKKKGAGVKNIFLHLRIEHFASKISNTY